MVTQQILTAALDALQRPNKPLQLTTERRYAAVSRS